ncbi:MAG: 23S rRNA (uracil(1939)-C(5))-methyltransferase RlmD [Anaeroplasmataceae bacterium]
MKLDEILELNIVDIDYQGLGIAKINDFPIFVNNALPGEKVVARITRVTKNIATAKNLKILEESKLRNNNICPYYEECGGCNIMHLNYDYQLEYKTKITRETIKKVSGLTPKINKCEANPNIYGYRNKIQVPLGVRDGEIISGFYQEKSHTIIPMKNCLIEPTLSSIIIEYIKGCLKKYNISIYDELTHKGLMRHIMLRVNSKNEIMIVLVATSYFKELNSIVESIKDTFKEVVSIYLNINPDKTNVVLGSVFKLCYGSSYLTENINGLEFMVHPNSFLQINHKQCENLYQKAIEYANINNDDIVIDAYCGIGSITLNIAKKAKKVYGIEVVSEAIMNAKMNMELNSIKNAEFICGKCEDEIKKLVKKEKIDVIVFDPPRKGCDIEFLNTVISMNIPKIVYISCKTSTFARDVKILSDNGYELLEVTPFDLFSHQTHTECCGILIKKG